MGTTKNTQFRLLVQKNFRVTVIRKKISFALEIIFPCLVACVLLWLRGYFPGILQSGFPWPSAELRDWPPGLEPFVTNANNESEFLLAYNHGNNDNVKQFMGDAIDRLNSDSIKWYSYDEFVLQSALYDPIIEIDTSKSTTEIFDNITTIVMPFVSSQPRLARALSDGNKNRFKELESDKEAGISVAAVRMEWLKNELVPLLQGEVWNHCNRNRLSAAVFSIASQLACTPTARSGLLPMGGDFNEKFFGELVEGHPEETDNLLAVFTETLRGSKLVSLIQELEAANANSPRKRRSLNLGGGLCGTVDPEQLAAHVHAAAPRVKVTAKEFATMDDMNKWYFSETDSAATLNELERRLASVEIKDVADFANGFPLNFTYHLRLPPSKRNLKPGSSGKFSRSRSTSSRVGRNWPVNMLKIPMQLMFPRGDEPQCTGGSPNYHPEGFSIVQYAVDGAYINAKTSNKTTDNVFNWRHRYARFPYGDFNIDFVPTLLQFFAVFFFMFGTMLLTADSIKNVVSEKETRIREYLKLMGANSSMQWAAWSAYYFFLCTLIAASVSQIMTSKSLAQYSFDYSHELSDFDEKSADLKELSEEKNDTTLFKTSEQLYNQGREDMKAVLGYSQFSVLWISLTLQFFQLTWFQFLLSCFLDNSSTAPAVACVVHFLTFVAWSPISSNYADLSIVFKYVSTFIPTLNIGHFWYIVVNNEANGAGTTWQTYLVALSSTDFSLFQYWLACIVNTGLCMFVTWYIEQIFPGEFGVSKPWWFLFDFRDRSKLKENLKAQGAQDISRKNPSYFEDIPKGADISVAIKGLTKKFKTIDGVKIAVNNVQLDMCHGEITSLLGHNGAGKTTMMNMLTGMMEPTDGTAVVNNHDITTDMEGVRSNLGLCPQFDILFRLLTIREHMELFAQLKGVGQEQKIGLNPINWFTNLKKRQTIVDKHVSDLIRTMKFEPYVNNYPTELSGGWKRRLSVCVALVGGSKTVFLDEPTSGMDPSTRRILWNILQEIKSERTMILSTHFMDEADILGDRVAIMSDGVLHCYGTSTYLKNLFGAGYHIMLSAATDFNKGVEGEILKTIKKHVASAKIERNIGMEMSVLLPFESVNRFSGLFADLDKNLKKLGIETYGIQLTSLDEVFLKCTEEAKGDNLYVADTHNNNFNLQDSKREGFGLALNRFKACFIKNVIVSIRDWITFVVLFITVCLFAWLTVVIKEQVNAQRNPRALEPLDMSMNEWYNQFGNDEQMVSYFKKGQTWNANTNVDEVMKSMDTHYQKTACGFHTEGDKFYNKTRDERACLNEGYTMRKNEINGMTYPMENYQHEMVNVFNQERGNRFDIKYLVGVGVGDTPVGVGSHPYAGYKVGPHDYRGLVQPKPTVFMGFNGQHFHGAGQTLNLASNFLLRYLMKNSSDAETNNWATSNINTWNSPLPMNNTENSQVAAKASSGQNEGLEYGSRIMLIVCVICSLSIKYRVNEKASKSKHVQFLTGLSVFTYWTTVYIIDMIRAVLIVVPGCLSYVFAGDTLFGMRNAATLADTDPNDTKHAWLYAAAYYLLLIWACLPITYICSLPFETTAVAVMSLIVGGHFGSSIYYLVKNIWASVDPQDVVPVNMTYFGMRAIPTFVFQEMIVTHYENNQSKYLCNQDPMYMELCQETNITYQSNYWHGSLSEYLAETPDDGEGIDEDSGVGEHVQLLLCQGPFYFFILLIIEMINRRWDLWTIFNLIKSKIMPKPNQIATGGCGVAMGAKDIDVTNEEARIKTVTDKKSEVLVTNDLQKTYYTNNGPLRAVEGISFGVKPGTCFGLLGTNGAGKTTAFKMLTGDETITSGECYLAGYSLKTQKAQAQRSVGYCPQFNALIDSMTGKETVEFYCDLRGLTPRDKQQSCGELLKVLDITPHMNKPCGIYSGGNKRKLSVALAMVGEPPLLFLDEPSTGMDPGARHALWDSIVKIQTRGTSVILTSHSMEECEALCSKLAIMVNGQFQCFGAIQHLRSRFGQGYTLDVELKQNSDAETIISTEQQILAKFNQFVLVLTEKNNTRLVYDIPMDGEQNWNVVKLSTLFDNMESLKKSCGLVSYSVRQRTLEELFLNFTKVQREDTRLNQV